MLKAVTFARDRGAAQAQGIAFREVNNAGSKQVAKCKDWSPSRTQQRDMPRLYEVLNDNVVDGMARSASLFCVLL